MLFFNLFASWQETFANAGDGDGMGEENRDQYLFHPSANIRFSLVFKGSINDFSDLFIQIIEVITKNKMSPGRRLLLTPEMGMGGPNRDPIGFEVIC